MIPELLGRLVWGTGKLAVRYVVVPIALTAILAAALKQVAERLEPDGHVTPGARPPRMMRAA